MTSGLGIAPVGVESHNAAHGTSQSHRLRSYDHRPHAGAVDGHDAGGVVASEHPLASQAGASILARGGHAVDAAIAANAVMGVVAPMMNGIGGDLFAIVYDAATGRRFTASTAAAAHRRRSRSTRSAPAASPPCRRPAFTR